MALNFQDRMKQLSSGAKTEEVQADPVTSQYNDIVANQLDEDGQAKYPYLDQYTTPVKKAEREIVGREKEMDRLLAAMERPELCNVILLAEAGSGKALANDTLIPVDDNRGYVPIGEIKVGDVVFDEEGMPTKVLGVYPQGMKDAYEVRFADGSTVVCNDEHLWSVRTEPGKYEVLTLQQMLDKGVGVDKLDLWYVHANEALCRKEKMFEKEPYGVGHSLRYVRDVDRRIPEEYFLGSYQQRSMLLYGFQDVDEKPLISTDNKEFADDIVKLATSLGIRAFHMDKMGNKKYCIHLQIREADDAPGYHDLAIRFVAKLPEQQEMTCIYVDSPNHLFQCTERHIVTHNTALVQGTMLKDVDRLYLEVDLSHMISDLTDANQMGDRLKQLFAEVQRFREENNTEIVLFMDEFHQVVQLSAAAVEALKPLLADSGTRGIRVIAATTFIEFRDFIQPNQPLVERLQRINLDQPDKKTVVQILKGMSRKYGVDNQFPSDSIFEMIYELTNRYVPANSQPRKSILVLDSMVGWYRHARRKMNLRLLSDVIYESEGVNIAFRVDATKIKEELDKHVFAQGYATSVIEDRLQVCVADLNDKTKPMSSFLFTGSTGTGKGLVDDTVIPVWTKDNSVSEKRNGDLEVGDYVFNRMGKPVKVTGVYHRGLQDIYKVSLNDGRVIYTDSSHLWTYLPMKGKNSKNGIDYTYTNSTKELYDRGVCVEAEDGRRAIKYWIPMNQAVEYPKADVSVHPYVMGAFIGDGCLTIKQLTLSSDDEYVVAKCAELLGNCTYKHGHKRGYDWTFPLIERSGRAHHKQTNEVFSDYPEVCGKYSYEKRIPKVYLHGSVKQRWDLVHGLFDTDGSIGGKDGGRYNVSYSTTSEGLAYDIQQLLHSLGVGSTVGIARAATEEHIAQYIVRVKSSNQNKDRFFTLPCKKNIAIAAKTKALSETGTRKKDFSWVGISDIEKMPYQKETTCIMVDDEEHLYQAGQHIVTHNTEVSKQLARVLFGDSRRLIRMDMTEYANPDSLDSFRRELTNKVWARPYSIVLLDEVEKACAPVTRLLLQVLDDGRLMDENNREVTFTNAYIILTTNAGSEVYKDIAQYHSSDTGDGEQLFKYDKLIRESISSTTGDNKFPPELLGRIDCLVPFQPLSEATQMKIVGAKLAKLIEEVRDKHGVELQVKKEVINYICRDRLTTESDAGGARAAIAKLQSEVYTAVARHINHYPDQKSIMVYVDGEMAWANKDMLESTACIRVANVVNA